MKFDVEFGEVQELKGEDGISPTVAVAEIEGGHRVTITDKDGAKSFDVMDGKDSTDSGGGASSWNDLADKPFGEEQAFEPIHCDDNKTVPSFDASSVFGVDGLVFYKVAEPTAPLDAYDGSYLVNTGYQFNRVNEFTHPGGALFIAQDESESGENEYEIRTAYLCVVNGENEYGIPFGVYLSNMFLNGIVVPNQFGGIIYPKETIKTIDEKYLPAPKLLGELVLTSENCTAVGDNSLNFNEELQATMSNLFEVIDKELRPLYIVLSVANVKHRCVGSYVANPDGRWVTTIASSSISGQPTDTWVGEDEFTSSDQTVISAVIGGYPVTIKVYAV